MFGSPEYAGSTTPSSAVPNTHTHAPPHARDFVRFDLAPAVFSLRARNRGPVSSRLPAAPCLELWARVGKFSGAEVDEQATEASPSFVVSKDSNRLSNEAEAVTQLTAQAIAASERRDFKAALHSFRQCLLAKVGDPITGFNLACVAARMHEPRFALEWFELSIEWGLAAVKQIVPTDDPDLHSLEGEPQPAA